MDNTKLIAALALFALAGCGPSTICVEGELYTDFDHVVIFISEAHDGKGKTPIRCIDRARGKP